MDSFAVVMSMRRPIREELMVEKLRLAVGAILQEDQSWAEKAVLSHGKSRTGSVS